jgi:hypothetical protein
MSDKMITVSVKDVPVKAEPLTFFVKHVPAEAEPLTASVIPMPCEYDPGRGTLAVPRRIETSPGVWIDNPICGVFLQWRALREEAIRELHEKSDSPWEEDSHC